MRIDQHTWRSWRSERGSQGIPAAGAALAAAVIVLALLGVAPRVGVAVERALTCAAAVLSGGGGCASGSTTPATSAGMPTYQAARQAPVDESAMPAGMFDQMRAFFDAILRGNAGDFLKHLGGFFKGFWEGGVDFLRGFGDLAKDLWGLVSGDPEVRQKYATLIEAFRADPPGMLKAMGKAVIAPVVEDWQAGRQGEAIGRLTFEVVSAVVGDKGVGKLAKLGKVEEVLGAIGRNADEIAALTRRANRIPCVGYGAPKGKGPGLAAPMQNGCDAIAKRLGIDLNDLEQAPNSKSSMVERPKGASVKQDEIEVADKVAMQEQEPLVLTGRPKGGADTPGIDGFYKSNGRPIQLKHVSSGDPTQIVKRANEAYNSATKHGWNDVDVQIVAEQLTRQQVLDRWAAPRAIPAAKPMPGGVVT